MPVAIAEDVQNLQELLEVGARADEADRLPAVLRAYAQRNRRQGGHSDGADAAVALHGSEHVHHAHAHLEQFLTGLIGQAAERGEVRTDVPPRELAVYCANALGGAGALSSKAAVERLVTVVMAGLEP